MLTAQQRELNNPLVNSADVLKKGVELHEAGKYKEAVAEYKKVPMSDSSYWKVLDEIIVSYYADSNFVEAEKNTMIGLDLFPEKKTVWLRLLADIYDDTKRVDKALNVYDTILSINPYDYLAYFNKGVCLYRQEKNDEAISCFQKCVMLNPYYASAHYFLGLASMLKGNMVQAMLSFSTNLIVSPSNSRYKKTSAYLVSIATMGDAIMEQLKKYKPGREDNFESVQDILVSKIALDKKYKLKADLEDQVVRQLQVMMEKLEYDPADKGFWMQYYVPLFKTLWDAKQFEPLIFHMFSELNIEKVKDYMKKEKKHVDEMAVIAAGYLNDLRKSQQLMYNERANTKIKYYIKDFRVTGKGEYGKNDKNEELLIGPWEFYYPNGQLKSKGTFDNEGLRTGDWRFYFEDGQLQEVANYVKNKANGKSESWHDNGLQYMISNYKDDETDGTEYLFYYNGHPRSTVNYKAGKKEGPAKYYTSNGTLETVVSYTDDNKQGDETNYYESGKVYSKAHYDKGEYTGDYTEYHENGQVKKTGSMGKGKSTGPWKWFYDTGKPEYAGTYVDGELDGEYLSYFKNGTLETRSFFKKGEIDGKKEYFDEDGIVYTETIFERGRLRDIKFFDKKGNVISNTTSRKGNADISFYGPDGKKTQDGYFTKDGQQDGKGTSYYKNGKINSTSNYVKGLQEGKKVIYYANGKVNQEGNYVNDQPDGYFVTYYNNGVVSEEGWYVGGQRQGTFLNYDLQGQLISKLYYLNDKIHGISEYYALNGKPDNTEYYDNGWLKKVVQFDTLGNILTSSELVKGEGKILLKHYNGKPYIENNYKYYNRNGIRTFTYVDGSKFNTSFYKNGLLDSIYRSWYPNGKLQVEGRYESGGKTGQWKYYWRNGTIQATEEYADGHLNGKNVQYNEDGSVDKEIQYKNGDLDGPCIFYADNKSLAVVLYYKKDELTGYSYEDKNGNLVPVIQTPGGTGTVTGYFRNGNKSVQMAFNESLVDGERILYFTSGKEYVSGTRINGDDEGVKKVYYPSGKLMKEQNFIYGNLYGPLKYYAENGNLISEENYVNDNLHGICKYYEAGKLTETLVYYYGILTAKK